MKIIAKTVLSRIQGFFAETFGLGRGAAASTVVLVAVVIAVAAFWFFHSAPPSTITIVSGPEGTLFYRTAERYAKILAKEGVTLRILTSEGSRDNLKRINDPKSKIDVAFIQAGIAGTQNVDRLVSLGSIAYEPLFVFYRSDRPMELLSQFKGKRLAVGDEGSGTRAVTLALLAYNGIEPGGDTVLLDQEAEDAAKALEEGRIDAAFMMGDSASSRIMRELLRKEGIRLFDFTQAEAYTRRLGYLNKLVLPRGGIDFGRDIPDHDVRLLAPTVELIASKDLHPALSDLLLSAATEVNGRTRLFQRRGEFPAPFENEYRLSADAGRYYKTGKSFLYRYLPFWVAGIVNRIISVIVPIVIILIPGLRLIPSIYQWRMRMRIYRWYGALLVLERDVLARESGPEERGAFLERLCEIEEAVNQMKVPATFADQFYGLRVNINFVRGRLESE